MPTDELLAPHTWHSWRILATGHYLHIWEEGEEGAAERFYWAITDTARQDLLCGPQKGYATFTNAKDGAASAFRRHRARLEQDHPVQGAPSTRAS